MKKWIGKAVLGVLVLLVLYFLFFAGDRGDQPFAQVAVKRGDIEEKAMAVGTIEPEKEIKVKSTISGIVAEVFFKVGDRIERGKPLFKISPNPTPLEYAETRRSMEMAEVLLSRAQLERERKFKLFKSDLISKAEMDGADSQHSEASLKHQMAREKFELLEKGRIQMSSRQIDSIVYSPISGTALTQTVFQGDPVVPLTNFQPGTELCSMAEMDKLLFKGTVDEIDVGKIEPRMAVDIQIGALPGTKIVGRLERIYPKAKKDGNATLFDVEIAIVSTSGKTLRVGYSAVANIKIRERNGTLLLPERLVSFENGKKFVEMQREKTIEKVTVETGLSDGLNVEIRRGLKEGDRVIERPPREIQ